MSVLQEQAVGGIPAVDEPKGMGPKVLEEKKQEADVLEKPPRIGREY